MIDTLVLTYLWSSRAGVLFSVRVLRTALLVLERNQTVKESQVLWTEVQTESGNINRVSLRPVEKISKDMEFLDSFDILISRILSSETLTD